MDVLIHTDCLRLRQDNPKNGLSMGLRDKNDNDITLYFSDLEAWWALHQALPKHEEYFLVGWPDNAPKGDNFIRDWGKANDMVAAFYEHMASKQAA